MDLETVMLQQELDNLRRSVSMLKNQIRNIIVDLEENEDSEVAVKDLKNLIGDE